MKCIPVTGKVPPEGDLIEDSDLDDLLVDLGDTLRHIRVAQRVQMVDLAVRGNMSPDVLSKIERGTRAERGLRQLYVTAGLLGVRLSDILRFSESWVMDGKGPWPHDGPNSPLVEAVLSTAPDRHRLAISGPPGFD
jgi:transcriptional regulator with XRE-family HTH domain